MKRSVLFAGFIASCWLNGAIAQVIITRRPVVYQPRMVVILKPAPVVFPARHVLIINPAPVFVSRPSRIVWVAPLRPSKREVVY